MPRAEAWTRLMQLVENPRTRLNPPAMDMIMEQAFEDQLTDACRAAVAAGVPKHKVFHELQCLYDQVDDSIPFKLNRLLLAHADPNRPDGIHGTLLHRLMQEAYPPGWKAPEDESLRDGSSLPELLQATTPNLADRQGDTALHILLQRSIEGKYFPDDTTSGLMNVVPGTSLDNWAQRAEYVEPAFRQLVEAGWSVNQPNDAGVTARRLLQEGLQAARNRVQYNSFQDLARGWPDEVAQAMTGFIGASIRGRKQMVTAFSIMNDMAAAQHPGQH